MRKVSYTVVDVFTTTPLTGNPLAVFTDARGVGRERMQAIAAELNLSETVFMLPAEGDATARVRIFTPRLELPFAGHPLVGTAFVIARSTPVHTVRLETGVGPIDIAVERDGGFVVRCVMTQPEPRLEPAAIEPHALEHALGQPLAGPVVRADNGPVHLLCPVWDVSAVVPDLPALATMQVTTIVAYAPPVDGEVHVRVFAPAAGVAEDPATGSAAGPLGAHLLATGAIGEGSLIVHQGEAMGRPSVLEVLVAHGAPPRVGGGCVPVARGFFELPGA